MIINKVEICGVNTSKLPVLREKEMKSLLLQMKDGKQGAREIFINGNAEETQVEISGTILSLTTLGDILTQTTTTTTLSLQTCSDKFYPRNFLQLLYDQLHFLM